MSVKNGLFVFEIDDESFKFCLYGLLRFCFYIIDHNTLLFVIEVAHRRRTIHI